MSVSIVGSFCGDLGFARDLANDNPSAKKLMRRRQRVRQVGVDLYLVFMREQNLQSLTKKNPTRIPPESHWNSTPTACGMGFWDDFERPRHRLLAQQSAPNTRVWASI